MPDLTYEIFFHCQSAEHFTKEVEGSKDNKYIVRYGASSGPYQYDYSCSCPRFKFKKTCKHIEQVKASGEHCGWMQFIEGSKPVEKDGKYFCPKCGLPAIAARYGV